MKPIKFIGHKGKDRTKFEALNKTIIGLEVIWNNNNCNHCSSKKNKVSTYICKNAFVHSYYSLNYCIKCRKRDKEYIRKRCFKITSKDYFYILSKS